MNRRWAIAVVALCLLPGVRAAGAEAPASETEQRIARLIEQLGDEQFAVRSRAQQELVRLGHEAFDALSEAENSDDPEVASQASYLVRLIRVDWTHDGDPKLIQQIFKDYEGQGEERRSQRIRQLAELPDDQGLPWLCRLVRFEKSPVLSKQAALLIIGAQLPADDAAWSRRVKTIVQASGRGRRPAVQWLTAYIQAHDDPAGALATWTALVDDERKTLEHHPQETQNQIVMDLLRRKVELLDRLGRDDEAQKTLAQMVIWERGDSGSLTELVDWLVKRKAWSAIDAVAERFGPSFENDPLLLYTLCEARVAGGQREVAEKLAEKALKLGGESPLDHRTNAERLLERGLTEWSDREWRHIIKLGPIASPGAVEARIILAESLHDRNLDDQAAEALRGLVEAMDTDANVLQQVRELRQREKSLGELPHKLSYYQACHAGRQNQPTKQVELLDQALEQDNTDIDVLIAAYKLSGDDAKKRAKILESIKREVDDLRGAIEDAPDEATNYNQLAWLVANTEGDFDDAIRLSQKSVDLTRAGSPGDSRRVAMFLDTLGHCFFAKKDYESAIRAQSEAVKLDPHSHAMTRQLKVFRQALADQPRAAK